MNTALSAAGIASCNYNAAAVRAYGRLYDSIYIRVRRRRNIGEQRIQQAMNMSVGMSASITSLHSPSSNKVVEIYDTDSAITPMRR